MRVFSFLLNQMRVQEMPGSSTVADLLERIIEEGSFSKAIDQSFWDDGGSKVNHKEVEDIHQKLQMGPKTMPSKLTGCPLVRLRVTVSRARSPVELDLSP